MSDTAKSRSQCRAARIAAGVCLLVGLVSHLRATEQNLDDVRFNRDVRPILADACFACHGPDAHRRQADLRLDLADAARSTSRKVRAILPGNPDESELMRRIYSGDPEEQMPPPQAKKKLTEAQKQTLRRWIEQGAKYEPHWSFIPPRQADRPKPNNNQTDFHPIDAFIADRLQRDGMQMSPQAGRETLVRRVTLDLTGLPPSIDELETALVDASPSWYETLVDRLLASPRYGERMAVDWLDAARYADTHGFHLDSERQMWRWREWVIEAFNENMPFDQFTIEQLAGDLLPDATLRQKLATGFNRNHPINFEGGAIPEEYQVAYVVDRANTTSTVWMGLTLGCAQCHDHKFDPITQQEFYQFFAFFNNIPEYGVDGTGGNAVPIMRAPSGNLERQLNEFGAKRDALNQQLADLGQQLLKNLPEWPQRLLRERISAPEPPGLIALYPLDGANGNEFANTTESSASINVIGKVSTTDGKIFQALRFDGAGCIDCGSVLGFERDDAFSFGGWVRTAESAETILSRMASPSRQRGYDLSIEDGSVFVHLVSQGDANSLRVSTKNRISPGEWQHLFATYDGLSRAEGISIYIDGGKQELEIHQNSLGGSIRTRKPFQLAARGGGNRFTGQLDDVRIYSRELTADEVATLAGKDDVRNLLAAPLVNRTAEQQRSLETRFLAATSEEYRSLSKQRDELSAKIAALEKSAPTSMVMREQATPRKTFLLERGEYDRPKHQVTAGVPAMLPPLPAGAPRNRLGLARWLVHPSHPLTARVAVNRFWQMFFGTGLVKTAEDFGTQGELPSHSELLDWLAFEFVRGGWNVKALKRLIVTSAAYKQSSKINAELLARDPENRLLARGPRFRLPAETIRDQALAIGGLLVEKLGGPSVLPYEPPGLWEELAYGGGFSAQAYRQGKGDDLYRRSLYTFWKRTAPPTALSSFDAPDREFCVVRRSRTNTPLQALILLNEPTYVEAARKLAERMIAAGESAQQRIDYGFRLATSRRPTQSELSILTRAFERRRKSFRADPGEANQLLQVGESYRNKEFDPIELAAWTIVASAILNLDETITKQ